jgi:hypothetical protein
MGMTMTRDAVRTHLCAAILAHSRAGSDPSCPRFAVVCAADATQDLGSLAKAAGFEANLALGRDDFVPGIRLTAEGILAPDPEMAEEMAEALHAHLYGPSPIVVAEGGWDLPPAVQARLLTAQADDPAPFIIVTGHQVDRVPTALLQGVPRFVCLAD